MVWLYRTVSLYRTTLLRYEWIIVRYEWIISPSRQNGSWTPLRVATCDTSLLVKDERLQLVLWRFFHLTSAALPVDV